MENIKYFDNAATTRLKEEVLEEMFPYLTKEYGNPSSLYGIGRSSKRAIEKARERVGKLIGANSNEIIFTGCGSESDNTAIKGIAYANKEKGNHIITSKIEHSAILESCRSLEKQGFNITYINVNSEGIIDLEELQNAITEKTILISIMTANNEIGTIQPIAEIAKIAKKSNIIFHTDAVQAVGNIPINVEELGVDMLSISAHKIYGPKGVGALYVRKGIKFEKFMDGGHQEKNKRSGTENVSGIVGLGKACDLANENLSSHISHLTKLRDYYITEIAKRIKDIKVNGSMEHRLPGNSNISFKDVNGEALLFNLDSKGICASTGSACNSGITSASHVLIAIGVQSNMANGTLRVTFGEDNNIEDVNYLIESLVQIVGELRKKPLT